MNKSSDSRSNKEQVYTFEGNLNLYLSQLRKISHCIRQLSTMVAPDDDERCVEFKRKQLYHVLSGDGLNADELRSSDIATEHLSKMNQIDTKLPWNLTFSYGRALQQDALNTWKGKNRPEAQTAFLNRAKNNSLATHGKF